MSPMPGATRPSLRQTFCSSITSFRGADEFIRDVRAATDTRVLVCSSSCEERDVLAATQAERAAFFARTRSHPRLSSQACLLQHMAPA